MSEFLQRLDGEIQSRCRIGRAEKILVAVSGGLDSMVLLHVLHSLAPKWRWKIVVIHFNHQLRGRSSDADEKLARKAAGRLGLPFVAGRAEVKRFARESKLSIEMAARKLRHDFFARIARSGRLPMLHSHTTPTIRWNYFFCASCAARVAKVWPG